MAEPIIAVESQDNQPVDKSFIRKKITKRLIPLYIAAFFHGFVLWYTVEKLFMRSIGFDDAGIGFMVAIYSVLMLFIETPSGILADRWSRKGVLIVASIALAISSLLCGMSTEPMLYLVGALAWGVFYAFYSGTYEPIVYDTVLEETGKSDAYEYYLGREKFIYSTALVLGAIGGGMVGQLVGLSAVYFWSIPFALLAVLALCYFKEPQLHKAGAQGSLKEHVKETVASVIRKKILLKLLVIVVSITVLISMLYEFNQLWYIALSAPPILFGPAVAAVLSSIGIGGLLASKLTEGSRVSAKVSAFGALIVSSLSLTITTQFVMVVIAQVLLGVSIIFLSILFMRELQDLLPSHVRAGASSAVNTIARLLLIPTALAFGAISTNFTVFSAAWIIVGLALISFLVAFLPVSSKE